MSSSNLLEIAVRRVKNGREDDFFAARSAFIYKLKQQSGVLVDREFQSFFALPEPDATPVYIGMTLWESQEVVNAAQGVLMGSSEMTAFFDTFDMKAYVMVSPPVGFDLATLAAAAGQVLEVAVRAVNDGMDDEFIKTRDAFVELLDNQDGAMVSYELDVAFTQNEGNITVGMTVYESQEKFQAILQSLQTAPEMGAYFQTFVPVAAQYALSASN